MHIEIRNGMAKELIQDIAAVRPCLAFAFRNEWGGVRTQRSLRSYISHVNRVSTSAAQWT